MSMWTACLLVLLQDGAPAQAEIDRAIDSGAAWLQKRVPELKPPPPPREVPAGSFVAPPQERLCVELVLWTLLHAGVPEKDPLVQRLLKTSLEQPVWRTYNASLLAMILQKLDPARHKSRLEACARFFSHTQADNGQWDYGDGYDPKKNFKRPPRGDNSNSQIAALGLRACRDAGLDVPEEVVRRALEWWEKSQHEDGSWNYNAPPPKGSDAPILRGCGSMTCGGVGSIAILESLLKRDPLRNARWKKGMDWLVENFSATDHPKYVNPGFGAGPTWWFYYYLYSLERAADLTATTRLGEADWYAEGAREILARQKKDGSWKEPSQEWEVYSTCFAVLFLKRATQPVIETPGAVKKK
jgi:hypothetical protein